MTGAAWPRTAVMGAGAVGCYFGGMLARAGAPVTLLGRAAHVEAIARDGLFLDTLRFRQQIPVAASTDLAAARGAEIVLFCVKTPDTETAAKSLAPNLSRGAVVVSLQNGVDNVERIREASGIEAIAAVVYVACAMTAPGRLQHSGRGDLIVGDLLGKGRSGDLGRIAAMFARAEVPCRVSANIDGELWAKLILNCAFNAVSALGRSRYGPAAQNPWTHQVIRAVVEEAVAVAGAAGIRLPDANMVEAAWKLAQAMENATSSTAQDLARGKRTEIDALNGQVAARGAQLGVPTPVNRTLHALVKLLEESV